MLFTDNNRCNVPELLHYMNISEVVWSGYHVYMKVKNNWTFLASFVASEPRRFSHAYITLYTLIGQSVSFLITNYNISPRASEALLPQGHVNSLFRLTFLKLCSADFPLPNKGEAQNRVSWCLYRLPAENSLQCKPTVSVCAKICI
jgi:hypothetical protein